MPDSDNSPVRLLLSVRLMLVLMYSILPHVEVRADELKISAKNLFARSVTSQLRLSSSQQTIELSRGVLYEDDGPAAGYSYQPNVEELSPEILVRKELIIPEPQATGAILLVAPGGELTAHLNGKEAQLEPPGNEGNYWRSYRFATDLLKSGKNEIVLAGEGKVWIARDEDYAAGSVTRVRHPNRSAKSTDDGKTWNDRRLGTNNDLDGEYYVRVFLDQYQVKGQLTTAVIDVGNLAGKPIGPPVTETGPIHIKADLLTSEQATVRLRARTGRSFSPDSEHWSSWAAFDGGEVIIDRPRGRYLQLQFELTTDDPLVTPALRGLTVSASPQRPADWTKNVRVLETHNGQIVRSSVPFQYEPFDQPELIRLRETFELDQLVEGADTELELIKRLASWSSTSWRKMHLSESYPSWNALEILKPHADGTVVGGFCQQHSLVFLQACESFGIPGRIVSVGPGNRTDVFRGGHETTEIWSNEYGKWIYVDGDKGWLVLDEKSQTPLSLFELRERQLAMLSGRLYRPIEVVELTETHTWSGLDRWPALVELRLIPRSNFLEQAAPLPLNQGMRGWFWTGHYVWSDGHAPARSIYAHRVVKRENFEWTLNQTQIALEARKPGALRVHLDTQTPGFKTFLRRIDREQEQSTDSTFDWTLHVGRNELQVVAQNIAGRRGSPARWIISVPETNEFREPLDPSAQGIERRRATRKR